MINLENLPLQKEMATYLYNRSPQLLEHLPHEIQYMPSLYLG